MQLDPFFLRYWYFHIPNYAIAVLIYTMFGRFLLGLFVPLDSTNFIMRFFRRLTDPAIAVIGPITPGFMPMFLVPLYAAFWLYVLRLAYWLVLAWLGLAPSLGGFIEPTAPGG